MLTGHAGAPLAVTGWLYLFQLVTAGCERVPLVPLLHTLRFGCSYGCTVSLGFIGRQELEVAQTRVVCARDSMGRVVLIHGSI